MILFMKDMVVIDTQKIPRLPPLGKFVGSCM